MAQEQTAYVGDDIKVLVNVIDSSGSHVAAVINTSTTRLDGLSAAPTVTTIATGIYQIVFSGVTPAPAEGDRYTCKVNGTIAGVAWTEYGIPVKIVANERGTDNVVVPTADIAAIKATTDQFTFTVSNQVDANTLTGGISEAGIRSAVGLASANLDTQLSAIPTAAPDNTGIADIKAATDQFVFTIPNQVDANAVTGGYPSGPGGSSTVVTVTLAGNPLENASVWVSTDAGGVNIIAGTLYTNSSGQVTFMLDSGTYYCWVQHSEANFSNPSILTVS